MDKGDAPGYVGKQTLIFDMPMSWAPQRVTCWWWTISCHAELPQEWHDFMSLVPGCTMGMPAYASCTPDVRQCQTCLHWGWAMVGHNSTIFWISRSLLHHFVNISMQNVQLWSDQTSLVCLGSASTNTLFDKIRVSGRFWTKCFKSILYTFPSPLAEFITIWLYTFGVKTTNQFAVPLLCNSVLYVPCCEGKLAPCSQDEGGGVSPTVAMLSGRLQGRMVGRHTLTLW